MPALKVNQFKINQAAKFLGVSSKTLRRWEDRSVLIPTRTPGNQRVYELSSLVEFRRHLKTIRSQSRKAPVYASDSIKNQILHIEKNPQKLIKEFEIRPAQKVVLTGFVIGLLAVGSLVILDKRGIVRVSDWEKNQAGLSTSLLSAREKIGPSIMAAAFPRMNPFKKVDQNVDVLSITKDPSVLAAIDIEDSIFGIGIPSKFEQDVEVVGNLTAPNITYTVTGGEGITVTGGQNPVVSLADDAVNGFGTITVGSTSIEAEGNDELLFAAGSNVSISVDTSTNKLTISSTDTDTDTNTSGWTDAGTNVRLTTSTDTVTVGSSLVISDAGLIDLSAVLHDDSAAQGLKLPQNTSLTNIGTGEGFLAYDSDDNLVKVFDGSAWTNISGASTTLQNAYDNDADGSNVIVALTTTDDSLIFRNPASGGTDSAYVFSIEQLSAGTTDTLNITNSGSGAGINLNASTLINIGNAGTDFTSTGGLTLAGTFTANGIANIGDGGDAITLSGTTYSLTTTSTNTTTLADNITNAFDLQESTNNYININTTNSSENISFGNSTTNPSYSFLGIGAVTITGSADGTDALILSAGDILVNNGDLDLSGGDFNVTLDAGDGALFTSNATATADALTTTLTGVGSDGIQINLTQSDDADATDNSAALRLALTSSSGDADLLYGIDIGNITEGTASEVALRIGSGWTNLIEFEGATDNDFEAFLQITDPTADRTYTLPNASGEICLVAAGNCAGSGTGVTTTGGTANTLTKFTGAQAVGNSTITDDGTVVTFNVDADLNFAASENISLTNTSASSDQVNLAISGITTNGVDGIALAFTQADDADATDINAGIDISVTGDSGDGDTLTGINIANLAGASAAATSYALQIGNTWDQNLYFNDTTTSVLLADGGTITITDGTNTLCTVTDAGTTGNLTCTGNITGGSSGSSGFWSRSGTTLSPATANDIVSIANTTTTGADLALTNTGIYTGTGIFNLAANSATTGTLASIAGNKLTTGSALSLSSTANGLSSGGLLSLSKTSPSGSTAFIGDIANLTYSQTFNAGVGLDSTGNVLDISRAITLDNLGNTHTISGAGITISDSGTQTAGTLTWTGDTMRIAQNYTGANASALNITTASTNAGTSNFALRVNDDGTFTDSTPFVVDESGNVGIGTTAPDAALEINHATGDSLRLTYNDADGSATNFTDFSLSSTGALTLTGSAATLGASATAEKTFLTLTPGIITLTAPTAVTSLMETAVFTGATIAADAATTVDKATTLSLVAPIDSTNVTLTDNSALRILNVTSGAGTLTNQYGLYIDNLTAGVNDYGIYVAGADSYSFYAAAGDIASLDDLFVGATAETIANATFALDGDDAFVSGMFGVEGDIFTDGDVDVAGGDITTANTTATVFNTNATTLNIGGAATTMSIGPTGATAASINVVGGSGATGCTFDGDTGNFTCSGNITGSSSGTAGFWTRSTTTLSPATSNDVVSISSNDTTNAVLALTSTGASANAFSLTANSTTTGNAQSISATGLTTGKAFSVTATNTHNADAAITQSLFSLTNAQSTTANSSFTGLAVNFTNNPSVAANTENAVRIQNQVTANITDNAVASLLLLDNADTTGTGSTVVTDALRITNSGAIAAGITNGINFASTTIATGINFSSTPTTNYISGTNFSVTAAGLGTFADDLAVNGGDITTTATTATLFNTNATTLSLGGAATTALNIGNGAGNYTAINLGSGAGTHTINIAGTGATAADTINIGTGGTGADTINIGSSASTTAINVTSGTGAQTYTSNVITGTTTTSGFVFDATAITSGTGLFATSDSITTGKLVDINTLAADTLSSGTLLNVFSESTGLTSGSLASFDWSPSPSATATGDLVKIKIGTQGDITGNLFNILSDTTSLFSVNETAVTSSLPAAFNATGDVSIAYDLVFTNQTASYIKSNAPLYLEAGETFENNNLTLRTYGTGDVVFDFTGAGGALTIDAASFDNTSTTGVIDLNVDSITTSNVGLNIDYISQSGGTAAGDQFAVKINLDQQDADADLFGLQISLAANGTTLSGVNFVDCFICLNNAENTAAAVLSAIDIGSTAATAGSITNGLFISTTDVTNDLRLQNGEIIDNNVDGTVDVSGELVIFLDGDAVTTAALCGNQGAGDVADTDNIRISDCSGTPIADYMEMYSVEEGIEYGDVVAPSNTYVTSTNGVRIPKLTKSVAAYQKSAIGIASDPDQAGDFNSIGYNVKEEDNPFPVALSGRLPVKVAQSSEPIRIGDYVTTSNEAGKAMKATHAGTTIGKALEDWDPGTEQQTVLVFVHNAWADPNNQTAFDENGNLVLSGGEGSQAEQANYDSQIISLEDRVTALEQNTGSGVLSATDSAGLTDTVNLLTTRLDFLQSQIELLQSATPSADIAEVATSSGSFTDLLVLGNTVLSDTVVNGKLTIGNITIDNINSSIDSLDTLSLQPSAFSGINFVGDKIEMTTDGNLVIKEGVIAGNDTFRGTVSLPAGITTIVVDKTGVWTTPPATIQVTPSFKTTAWITDITADGFTVNVSSAPTITKEIFWSAIW